MQEHTKERFVMINNDKNNRVHSNKSKTGLCSLSAGIVGSIPWFRDGTYPIISLSMLLYG